MYRVRFVDVVVAIVATVVMVFVCVASLTLSPLPPPLPRPAIPQLMNAEIDLPEGHEIVVDDGEVDLGESMEAAEQEELKWTDKGIDLLLQREGGAPAASN